MSNKDLSKLALKLFAIYAIVQALLAIPQFFQAYVMLSNGSEYNSGKWFMLISGTSIITLLILSVIIWKLANKTTEIINKNTNQTSLNISEEFVLSILGLYLIIHGLTRLVAVATGAYYSLNSINNVNYEITQSIIYLAVYFIVVILGVSFIIKSNGWSALLNKLRLVGTH